MSIDTDSKWHLDANSKWHLSCTAIWEDAVECKNLKKLYDELEKNKKLCKKGLVYEESRHSTILHILSIEATDEKNSIKIEEGLKGILEKLKKDKCFQKSLNLLFSPIEVMLYEIWDKTDGIKFQFCAPDNSHSLKAFRQSVKTIIQNKLLHLIFELKKKYKGKLEWNLYIDEVKNCGNRIFGSYTRKESNEFFDGKITYPLIKAIKLTFNKIYLLVSNRDLSNKRSCKTTITIEQL